MPDAIVMMQWSSYVGDEGLPGIFRTGLLTFNSRQERLHRLSRGDSLWLVSRCPDDMQYYIVGVLRVTDRRLNEPRSPMADRFGQFAVVGCPDGSADFGKRFPAEGLLRALAYETGRPLKYGAFLGQSLQTLRFLSPCDQAILSAARERITARPPELVDYPYGLWTKCDARYARYFLANWRASKRPLAFLLYDPPPSLGEGAPVFIHSDKNLRMVARFREAQYVAGHKITVDAVERAEEQGRIWRTFRRDTIDAPSVDEFECFWDSQNGVRGLFTMDSLHEVTRPCPFRVYGGSLQWGYPRGVGYRYLTVSQSLLLLRCAEMPQDKLRLYLPP